MFRDWLLTDAPTPLRDAYVTHGETFAGWLRDKPVAKALVKLLMDRVVTGRPLPSFGL